MVNYLYDCYQILTKVYSDGAYFKQALNQTPIEEINRALVVKTCYGVLDRDIELSYYIKRLCDKSPKLAVRTILKISMYAIKYLEKKEYAITKNAVELIKKLGKGGTSGFVNAFLRKFVSTQIDFPKDRAEYLSVKYSYPLFAVKLLLDKYGDRTESIISAKNNYNTLVFYGIDGEKYLKERDIDYSKTPFENVFSVKNFTRNSDYDRGLYTYQAIGSVAICEEVNTCDNLLDCCAAPGGKSVRLSYRCKSVTSCDIHPHRVELINSYANRMNRDNIRTRLLDASVFNEEFKGAFDGVLCDVPCSGLGVINDNPDIKLNREYENVKELNRVQLAILKNASSYVKVGGYLYYSTCSILDSENIAIIEAFMSDVKGFEIVKIDSKLQHEDQSGTNLFLPDISNGLGFYVAKLKRV